MNQANWHKPQSQESSQVGSGAREYDELRERTRHMIENFEYQEAQKLEHFRVAEENARRRRSLTIHRKLIVAAWLIALTISTLTLAVGGASTSNILGVTTLIAVMIFASRYMWITNDVKYGPLVEPQTAASTPADEPRNSAFTGRQVPRRRLY